MCAYRSLGRDVRIRSSRLELPVVNQRSAEPNAGVGAHSATVNINDARLRRLLELIETSPLSTIQDWALAFNLSNSHLQRLFKQMTGLGLGQVLTEKRLRRAANLLLHTNMRIKEVAHAVGYEHTSSFTRAFEKYFEEGPPPLSTTECSLTHPYICPILAAPCWGDLVSYVFTVRQDQLRRGTALTIIGRNYVVLNRILHNL